MTRRAASRIWLVGRRRQIAATAVTHQQADSQQ